MKRNLTIAAAMLLGAITTIPAFAEGVSREQGDTIINELRQIRQLLEKQQKPGPSPSVPAPPQRVRLKIGNDHALGREDAPLVVEEYTDYQCPYCNRFYTTTFPELKKQYIDTGKMRFISRDFPLEFHQNALKAAEAARCAGDQGKFWQMKDALMLNYSRLTPELIGKLAADTVGDTNAFKSCLESGKHTAAIRAEIAAAQAVGITGTPSFILGRMTGDTLDGYLIVGAQPFSYFDSLAKELLGGKK